MWVSLPYAVVRVDPDTGRTLTVPFDLLDADALPGAVDEADPLPGTWVSGIAAAGSNLIVARNHVAHLEVIDATGKRLAAIPIAPESAGASDLVITDSAILLAAGYAGGSASVFDRTSGTTSALPAAPGRLDARDGSVLAFAAADRRVEKGTTDKLSATSDIKGVALDVAALGPSGRVVGYDARSRAFVELAGGTIVRQFNLPRQSATVLNPLGQAVDATIASQVDDMAIFDDGSVWFVDASAGALVKVSW